MRKKNKEIIKNILADKSIRVFKSIGQKRLLTDVEKSLEYWKKQQETSQFPVICGQEEALV